MQFTGCDEKSIGNDNIYLSKQYFVTSLFKNFNDCPTCTHCQKVCRSSLRVHS